MSLAPIERKSKKSEMKAGVHLATISDIFWHRTGKEVVKDNGVPGMIFRFRNEAKEEHDQLYWVDGGAKQRYMDLMLQAAGVDTTKGKISKKEAIGKKLWLCIRELHYISDDKPRKNDDGTDMIEYHIFKITPYNEGVRPKVFGDPADNDGNPAGDFVDYKNVEDPFAKAKDERAAPVLTEEAKKHRVYPATMDEVMPPKTNPSEEEEMPVF